MGKTSGAVSRLLAHHSARWAVAIIAFFIVVAVIGPMLFSATGNEQPDIVGMKNLPPSIHHLFGTDQYSREVLIRVVRGARISLAVSILAVVVSMTVGTAYGLIAGYAGGRTDSVMMRILDAFLSIPRVLLLIAVLSMWQPVQLPGLIILLGTTGWFGLSRLVRAEALSARRMDYVEAARALGVPHGRLLWRHLLPNVIGPVIVTATLAVGNVIALESGLSFLGIGAREPTPSWGSIFLDGIDSFAGNWWVAFFPGVAIVTTVLAFNVLGDALRDVLDPRQLHARRSSMELLSPLTSGPEPLENG